MPDQPTSRQVERTFSYRAVLIGIAGMILMGMWVHFHEVLSPQPTIIAENSPPASAVGVLVAVILVGGLVAWVRPRLRLSAGELVVIYTMLVIAAPLMSQGMWHRFLGLVTAIPHNKPNFPLADSYSDKLWPHGAHLVENRRFDPDRPLPWRAEPAAAAQSIEAADSPIGRTRAVELVNRGGEGVDEAALLSTLRLRIPRRDASGREQLVPADRYYFSCLLRLAETGSRSRLSVDLVTAAGESVAITSLQRATEANYSDRGAFRRIGEPYVNLPSEPGEHVELVFTLEGPGRAAVADVVFFSNEAIARLYKGSTEVRRGDLERVPESERGSLLVRPDNLASPAGVWYVLKGYVPYRQWLVPLVYWMSIVLAVFLCTLGMGVILRRQWADNERFPFPLVMLPRLLIEDDPGGRPGLRPIFRKRTFQAGVVAAFVYTGLLGLAFYIPNLPSPKVSVNLVQYVDSPAMKAFMQGMAGANFEIIILMVAVAFFIDLDMLLSILVFFWLSRIPYFLGEVFGWKNIRGPIDWYPFPHEQHLGAFLGLALIVLWVSRKHLRAAALRILGRGGVSDAGEIMSYRAALAAIIVSFVFFALWGVSSGLGAVPALVFFGFIVVCGLSAARIRTECGVPWTYFTPYYPHLVFFMLGGLAVFGTSTLVLSFCVGGFMAVAQFLMFAPSQVEMMHLGNTFNANPKGIRRALILGLIGGVIIGGYVMLVWAYGRGGENIKYMKDWGLHQDWYLRTLRDSVTDANAQMMSAAGEVARGGRGSAAAPIIASGIGLGVTVLLVALRSLFVGFWLHPIGYVLANAHFSYMCWGSLLVAWLIRLLSLKLGGPRLVREHMAPLMAGAFCGALLGMAVWDVIGLAALGCGVRNIFTPFP